ncbi:MAG: hypothetical protein U0228_02840 [Myxococcaceae bacterium]
MAKPPEPIEEVMPNAHWVVEAEVTEVVSTGAAPPKVQAKPGATSTGQKSASQTLKLKVTRVLFGEKVAELVVEKPEAGYSLRAGNKGPFIIDSTKTILGRYGPDSYSLERVEKAVKARR